MRFADAREEQAEIVVNFGRRANRGARVAAQALLLDGNRGGQAFDGFHVRLVHLLQKLPRISRQRLDVAALAFGVNRVERERRFARSARPRNHDELVAGNVKIDIFEIVLFRASNADLCCGHNKIFERS